MIIKLPLMLHNIVSKQFKISHVPCDVIAFKKEDIPANISKLIVDQYDEKFLEDCDTVMFIKGPIDKDMRKKIFKACDKALGEGANMMNETDFRLLKLHDDDAADFGSDDSQDEEKSDEQKIDDQVKEIVNEPDEEEQQAKEKEEKDNRLGLQGNSDTIADSLEESDDKDDDSDSDEDDEDDKDDEEEDEDEDDSSDDEEDEAEETVPTRYVFLKISMKS